MVGRGPGGYAESGGPPQNVVDFTFKDAIDTINPLHHIPVVSSLYRGLTGDSISGPARSLGDMLYGGPIAAVTGAIASLIEDVTGKEPGAHAIAMLTGQEGPIADLLAPGQGDGAVDLKDPAATPTAPIMVAALSMPDTPPQSVDSEPPSEVLSAVEPALVEPAISSDVLANEDAEASQADDDGPAITDEVESGAAEQSDELEQYDNNETHPPVSTSPTPETTAAKNPSHLAYGGVIAPAAMPEMVTAPRQSALALSSAARNMPSTSFHPLTLSNPIQKPIALTPQQVQSVQSHTEPAKQTQNRGSDPLPPALIHDMMMLNLQKYSQMQGAGLPSPFLVVETDKKFSVIIYNPRPSA